jgi:hypothetical protein
MRLYSGALYLLLALGALAAQGCSTEKIFYNVNLGSSEPTQSTDKPGIWFDRERQTATRPLPIPIQDIVVYFEIVKPDGTRTQVETPAHTTKDGWTFFRGKLEVDNDWKFALRTKKPGYTNFERIITIAQAKDATMTMVLSRLGAPPPAPKPGDAPEPTPAPADTKG